MNCNEAQWQFDEYRRGGLKGDARCDVDVHVTGCQSCKKVMAEQLHLNEQLRALPFVPMSEGFADRAMRRAVSHHLEQRHRVAFYKGFSSALAAGLLLWLAVGLISTKDTVQPEQVISIALQETLELKLAFHSVKALENATISIQLPDNVQLVGYEGRQTLEWQANLNQGDNMLRLPIRALRAEGGQLVAQVRHAQQNKTIKIRLNVSQPGLTERVVQSLLVV